MAIVTRLVSDVLTIMRRALSRRNANDPDSSDSILLRYLNDFVALTMSNDVKLFEQFGTLIFTIDGANTSGVYTFNDVGAGIDFINLSCEAFISYLDPVNESVSWNRLQIFQDPLEFFGRWGINNDDILVKGYPTQVLFYGNELTFRTIPQEDESYQIRIYGYKMNDEYPSDDSGNPTGNTEIQFAYWLRYLAYGASMDYARDFNYAPQIRQQLQADFSHERKLMLTRTHNQAKMSRGIPNF